ncbi:MAG: M16 family metallopeptidase [Myxococcota bacterium]
MARWWWVAGVVATCAVAQEEPKARARVSTSADLTPRFERYVTKNGMVVLLAPDERTNHVVVDLSFAAGALHQPAKKAGLAHLTEHVVATGIDTDYQAILEARGGVGFNAFTSPDRMNFRVAVPPEELPLALWVDADRLGTLRDATLERDALLRHQRIAAQERIHRVDDAAYGGNVVATLRHLFPDGHPLHTGVIGSRDEILALAPADVLAFARRHLVPANSVLTIVGRFSPELAKAEVERLFADLPAGEAAPAPPRPPLAPPSKVTVTEDLGRRSKVTLAWNLAEPMADVSEALAFGSLLLTIYTDGFVGMHVEASYLPLAQGAMFTLEVTMPHATDKLDALGNAEVVFRFLARAPMPKELVGATFLAWDRALMERLQSPEALATLLVNEELRPREPSLQLSGFERHWALTPDAIQELTAAALKAPHLTVLARPTRPLPRRELRQ